MCRCILYLGIFRTQLGFWFSILVMTAENLRNALKVKKIAKIIWLDSSLTSHIAKPLIVGSTLRDISSAGGYQIMRLVKIQVNCQMLLIAATLSTKRWPHFWLIFKGGDHFNFLFQLGFEVIKPESAEPAVES